MNWVKMSRTELNMEYNSILVLNDLDIPPSLNHCYTMRIVGKRIMKFRSKNFDDYIKYLSLVRYDKNITTIDYFLEAKIDVFFRGKISDIDNILKVLFDALQASGIIKNDNLIKRLGVDIKKSENNLAYLNLELLKYI